MLNCDNGTYDAWYWAHPPQYMPNNCNLAEVEHIKNFCDIPVVLRRQDGAAVAAQEIAAGKLDAVAIARQNLVDPEWLRKLQEGREEDIKPCIRCHNGCFNFAKYKGTVNLQSMDDTMHLARCALTPPTMQHNKYKIVRPRSPRRSPSSAAASAVWSARSCSTSAGISRSCLRRPTPSAACS